MAAVMTAHGSESTEEFDVIVIGAGCSGLYALYHMRRLGLRVRAFESGGGVGGTWYWNRYPGARVDIESLEYSYAFSDEIQQEWSWSERYASQPELERYFNFVTDRLDLRREIDFDTRVNSAVFDEGSERWNIRTSTNRKITATFCIMTTGLLSAPNEPHFRGQDSFRGARYMTSRWPAEGADFSGQRVGVIGTGSSAVQCIPLIAEKAAHLHVFQRTPGYCVPLRNHPMDRDYEKTVKENYADWRHKERYESFGGWVSVNYKQVKQVMQSALAVSREERLEMYEDRWKNGGLAFYNIYPDIFSNKEANDTLAEFVRDKIRARIKDPALAELLMPKFPVLTKRLMADTNYYETYNRDNVTLVDIHNTPIDEITPTGLLVDGKGYEFDSIVFATGFDALTGALTRMDIRGRASQSLKNHWVDGARTHLGLMSAGFPNLFIIAAAGSPAPLYQPILLCEEQTNWVGDCILYLRNRGLRSIEPTVAAEDNWGRLCDDSVAATLFPLTNSWYVGANVSGKSPAGLAYFGGIGNYRLKCSAESDHDYPGFHLNETHAPAETMTMRDHK